MPGTNMVPGITNNQGVTMGFFHDLFMLILAILAGIGLMHLSMMFQ